MYGYIYKTTNKINGKIYIGQHRCDHFDESYIGSGSRLLKAVKKYGRCCFETVGEHRKYIQPTKLAEFESQGYWAVNQRRKTL